MATVILRLPTVLARRGRSRSAHYLDIQQGLFTSPIAIGDRAVGCFGVFVCGVFGADRRAAWIGRGGPGGAQHKRCAQG